MIIFLSRNARERETGRAGRVFIQFVCGPWRNIERIAADTWNEPINHFLPRRLLITIKISVTLAITSFPEGAEPPLPLREFGEILRGNSRRLTRGTSRHPPHVGGDTCARV